MIAAFIVLVLVTTEGALGEMEWKSKLTVENLSEVRKLRITT